MFIELNARDHSAKDYSSSFVIVSIPQKICFKYHIEINIILFYLQNKKKEISLLSC